MRLLQPLLVFCAMFLGSIAGAEQSAYNDMIGDRIQELVNTRDFNGLQSLADGYRRTMSRSPSGMFDLSSFYKRTRLSLAQLSGCDGCDGRDEAFVREWRQARPNDIASNIMLADVLLSKAFELRGGGYAETVRPENWARIKRLDEAAAKQLINVKSSASTDPQWYSEVLMVSLLRDSTENEVKSYYDEGVRRFPNYLPIYVAMANYLEPHWFGSWAEVDSLARGASAAPSPNSIELYAGIYIRIGELCGCTNVSKISPVIDWPMMKRSMRAIENHYPSVWNVMTFAQISCAAEDFVEARHYFEHQDKLWAAAPPYGPHYVGCGVPSGKKKLL